ncbi:MAG: helix-turn-helix domain-containing protein [Burkholderiaceae bacterium]
MKKTQQQKVLAWLKAGNSITNMQAMRLFKATRLGDVIYQLRKKGFVIEGAPVKSRNGATHHRYWMDRV